MQLTFTDTAAILDAKNEVDLLQRVQLCTRTLGFDRCLFGVESGGPLSPKQQRILWGYPDEWQLEYQRENYAHVDPTVRHCVTSNDPVVWHEDLFVGNTKSEALWETARSFGLGYGLSVPVHDTNGAVSSMFSVARDQKIESGRELIQALAGAKTIAAMAHVAATRLVLPNLRIAPPRLTKRELEVLKYIVIGKNRWEISIILKLSESAVAFHTSNLLHKFDVSNRTQLSVKAVSMNLT